MAERPILFSGPMVKAILEGRKTQTRRFVRLPVWTLPNPQRDQWGNWFWLHDDARPNEEHLYAKTWPTSKVAIGSNPGPCCPYGQPGDELWVRETFFVNHVVYEHPVPKTKPSEPVEICYRADGELREQFEMVEGSSPWRSPIHMPRWASRLQLVIRDVRVQRLQEISEEDAVAEGVDFEDGRGWTFGGERFCGPVASTSIGAFGLGWDSINGKRAPWSSNPFVWAITFERKV